jgi:hypothetical protein
MVGPKQMSLALTRLAGVRSSQFGAQAASIIRSLPNQQQLLLYSLAVLCQQPADATAGAGQAPVTPSKGGKVAASSLWQGAGSAAVLSSSNAGCSGSPAGGSWSAGLKKKKKAVASRSSGQAGAHCSVFVLAVTADAAYIQYCKVCEIALLLHYMHCAASAGHCVRGRSNWRLCFLPCRACLQLGVHFFSAACACQHSHCNLPASAALLQRFGCPVHHMFEL